MADDEIVIAHHRRLAELRLRVALQGYAVPPEVRTEIEDIRRELHRLGTDELPFMAVATPPVKGDWFRQIEDQVDRVEATQKTHSEQIAELGWVGRAAIAAAIFSGIDFLFLFVFILERIFAQR